MHFNINLAGRLQSKHTVLLQSHQGARSQPRPAVPFNSCLASCSQFEQQYIFVAAAMPWRGQQVRRCCLAAQVSWPAVPAVPAVPSNSCLACCRQFERQYIFVAATMPSEGKKSIAAALQQKFPDLLWLAGHRLHQGLATVQWRWLPVSPDSWRTTLQVTNKICQHMQSDRRAQGTVCIRAKPLFNGAGCLSCLRSLLVERPPGEKKMCRVTVRALLSS